MSPPLQGPLAGVRVLEVGHNIAAGYCGHLLALMGAEVFRVTATTYADVETAHAEHFERSLHGLKRQISTPAALAQVTEDPYDLMILEAGSIDGRDDWMELGRVAGINVVEVSGYRRTTDCGTSDVVPATSITVTARSGLAWGLGSQDKPPLTLPYDLAEYLTGAEAAGAACTSLFIRESQHEAVVQQWDVTGSDVLAYYVGQISSNFIPYERPWRRDGARATMSGGSYPAAMFPTKDGWVSIMCRTNREWAALIKAMGDPAWTTKEGFQDARVVARQHAAEADVHLHRWTSSMTREEMFAKGREFGFPIAPVLSVVEAMDEPQILHRGFFPHGDCPSAAPGAPWRIQTRKQGSTSSLARSAPPKFSKAFDASRPLTGLRVLDLSWVWSGPMVTSGLRDLGAEVLKVEFEGRPDPARLRGPALRDGSPVPGPDLEVTPYFNQLNHGKKSIAIDITTPDGARLVRSLAADSDLVVENMRPGVLESKGLGYETLSQQNPSLVMLSMSMTGQTGPLSTISGYAPVMSGLAGLDSITGYSADDLIGTYNPALGDPVGAAHALGVAMAALFHRETTGRGMWIDLSQVECLMSTMRSPLIQAHMEGRVRVPANGHASWWPHGTYPTQGEDSWISVAVRDEEERERLCIALDLSPDRVAELPTKLEEWLRERPAVFSEEVLTGLGIPAAVVADFDALTQSPWLGARGGASLVQHPWLGPQLVFTLPWKLGGHAFKADQCAPLLGQHTDEVLSQYLNLRADELADLRCRQVIQ